MTLTDTQSAPAGRRLNVSKAMGEAISSEMERDETVVYLGEDVGEYGGIFSSTTGLLEQFGKDRIIDTPISETAFIGLGIGAATEGMRPIVELMFADFMGDRKSTRLNSSHVASSYAAFCSKTNTT